MVHHGSVFGGEVGLKSDSWCKCGKSLRTSTSLKLKLRDQDQRNASSPGRNREIDIHVVFVGNARFAQTLGAYYN